MLRETREDKLSVREEDFVDVQFGSQVSVFMYVRQIPKHTPKAVHELNGPTLPENLRSLSQSLHGFKNTTLCTGANSTIYILYSREV